MKVMRVTVSTKVKKLKIKNNKISKKCYMRSNCKDNDNNAKRWKLRKQQSDTPHSDVSPMNLKISEKTLLSIGE